MEVRSKSGPTIGEAALTLAILSTWVMGIALAKGFWSVALAICCPPYAWVLFAKWAMGV